MKQCINCHNWFDETIRHHPCHRSQGGQGTYVHVLCDNCEDDIENATKVFSKQILSCAGSAINSSTGITVGSTAIHGANIIYTLQYKQGAGSGVNFTFSSSCADINFLNTDGFPISKQQLSVAGSTAVYVSGSPTPNSPIFIVYGEWN